MNGIHPIDILVVLAYLAAIIYIGRRAKHAAAASEEGYFLAGRKLGKLYQIFLNFGNATEPQGAVSNASFVYKGGAANAWYSFQTIFINPYYWFMNVWFRRVRLLTMADLFVDRLNSRAMGVFYSLFQIGVAVLLIGFGSFTAYKITASLVTKAPEVWTAEERSSIEGFKRWRQLETRETAANSVKLVGATRTITPAGKPEAAVTVPVEATLTVGGALTPEEQTELKLLRDRNARGELHSTISVLQTPLYKWTFYVVFVAVVAIYMVMGGMTAAAFAEALQGTLIIVFSILLIPTGIAKIGGWSQLGAKVSKASFDLFGGEQTGWGIFAVTLVSLIQMNALSPNMNIMGSAKNETAARMGVLGLYGKRLMIILWTFTGLIAIAMFSGENALADPDTAWGSMSKQLLGPGLVGLMLAGVVAAVMSNLAAKSMAVSSLFVRNIYRLFRPNASDAQGVFMARATIVVVLVTGLLAATFMKDMMKIVQMVITVNVPFGVLIMMIFFWRRLTMPAAWAAILLSVALNITFPLIASSIPAIRDSQALAVSAPDTKGKPVAVFWESVVHVDKNDLTSPLQGKGRFDMESYLVHSLGIADVTALTPKWRENIRYFVDAALPFLVLVIVSLLTKNKNQAQIDLFYGKMKTPIGETPEADLAAMEETRKNPGRFDHQKLFGAKSSWEFGKWDRQDGVGFIACCAGSGAIILLFWGLLTWAASTAS